MKRPLILLLVIGCGIAVCAPMAGAVVLPGVALVVRPRELPGFVGSKGTLQFATSAVDYAELVRDDPTEAEAEVTQLTREGFEEGVEEFLAKSDSEAISDALVFSGEAGARQEFEANVSEDLSTHAAGGARFRVAAIPGSVGVSQFHAGRRGASADVLFVTGRCFFVVGDAVHDASARSQGERAPTAGAVALYRRVKRLCE